MKLSKTKIWVVKIGSSILTDEAGRPDFKVFKRLAKEVAALKAAKKQVVIVSSGAIACGMDALGLSKKPAQIPQKQAIAAVGQTRLIDFYAKAFAAHDLTPAQILLTGADIARNESFLNAREAIKHLLKLGLVPVINENDTVATEEIKVGDNDNLAALVTHVAQADLLVILTDQEGLYTDDPRTNPDAEKIDRIFQVTSEHFALAQDTKRAGTTGGMITKLQAAKKAAEFGVPTILASGRRKGVLLELLANQQTGTWIFSESN